MSGYDEDHEVDVDALAARADALNLEDEDLPGDDVEEEEEIETFPPPHFRSWDPFPDMNDDDVDLGRIDELCQQIFEDTEWGAKVSYIKEILQPYLQKYENQYSGWPEKELLQIVEDAAAWENFVKPPEARSQEAAEAAKRYFFDDLRPKYNDKGEWWCTHGQEYCCCWFNATPTAGIASFPERRKRDRKPCIEFVHNLMVELLIFLTAWGTKTGKLNHNQQWALHYAILGSASPKTKVKGLEWTDSEDPLNNDAEADVMDPAVERYDFLYNDSMLFDMGNRERYLLRTWPDPNFFNEDEENAEEGDEEGGEEEEDEHNDECGSQCDHDADLYIEMTDEEHAFIKLLATLGRRCLAVAVSRWSKAALFERRQPSEKWDFSEMVPRVDDLEPEGYDALKEYIIEHPRGKVDSNIYPLRVIDTETLEFEWDRALFSERYAVLSHTWMSPSSLEVTYDTIGKVLAAEKEKKVKADLAKYQKELQADMEACREYREQGITHHSIEAQIKETLEILKSLKQELEVIRAEKEKERRKREFEEKQAMERDPSLQNRGPKRDLRKKILGEDAPVKENAGVLKLRGAINKARELGYQYIWIDNCCINKPDLSELAESISSMGDWYKNSSVCIVYLEDFEGTDLSKAKNIRWATRGWTLQELVMSRHVKFYNKKWQLCFDTADPACDKESIAKVCRVPARLIACGGRETEKLPASTILALAADRVTYKPEDAAYSLMGLLNVRIVPDYGEKRERALQRIIDAVLRSTRDVSVFNWIRTKKSYPGSDRPGKSLYPIDFSGYSRTGIKLLEKAEPDQKLHEVVKKNPVIARSEITLGTSGVNARFDVWQPRITIEGDNEAAYRLVRHLRAVQDTLDVTGKPREEIQCSVRCTFHNEEDTGLEDLEIQVYCTLDQLEKQLKVELGEERTLTSAWVLARFSRAYGANWFLAALEFDPKLCEYGLFKDRFKGQRLEDEEDGGETWRPRIGDFSHFMHYMESDGFPAKKLETDPFKRDRIPMDDDDETDDKYIKNINLWVG